MKPNIEYLSDRSVDDATDAVLRGLLSTCFTQPGDYVFKERRYSNEPYPHRWVIRDEKEVIVAHVGVHNKHVEIDDCVYRIGGVGDLCVHPDYRGRHYVRIMLESVHDWLLANKFVFSVLFGSPDIYLSSGYVSVENLFYGGDEVGWKQADAMVKELTNTPWPSAEVHLPGQTF